MRSAAGMRCRTGNFERDGTQEKRGGKEQQLVLGAGCENTCRVPGRGLVRGGDIKQGGRKMQGDRAGLGGQVRGSTGGFSPSPSPWIACGREKEERGGRSFSLLPPPASLLPPPPSSLLLLPPSSSLVPTLSSLLPPPSSLPPASSVSSHLVRWGGKGRRGD